MVGLRLSQLPNPAPEFDPVIRCKGFETEEAAAEEDKTRAAMLRDAATNMKKSPRQRRILELARRLNRRVAPGTMASKRFMRELRRRVVGAMLELMAAKPLSEARFFTLVPPSWGGSRDDFRRFDLKRRLAAFRQVLNRCDAKEADGWLMLFVEADYDRTTGRYQLHMHGIASGGMVQVVDALRTRAMFEPSEDVRNPVRVQRIEDGDDHAAQAASYCLKGMAPVPYSYVGDDGVRRRSPNRHRLGEPQHTDVLLWYRKYRLRHIALLIGVRPGKDGLIPSRRSM